MKVFLIFQLFLVLKLTAATSKLDQVDMGDKEEVFDDVDEGTFDDLFDLPPPQNEAEMKKRTKALKLNEAEIKKTNKAYEEGKDSWFDKLNDFEDLPGKEFIKSKTGATDGIVQGRGLLEPLEEERVDEESERYFDQFRYSRDAVPASYSSVDQGYVSPIKNQRQCGSCVAFASGAVIETCFKKKVGVFGDYSEQQYLDCGFGQNGANGCNGAAPHAYLKWTSDNGIRPCHESQYPYQGVRASCPANLPVYNQGVRISGVHYTYQGDEELMKRMVYEHGAVVSGVKSEGPFQSYGGGVFAGCAPGTATDHAITVVGYGTDNGVDYWLIKNSWGPNWGENGFIRLRRGVNMCGIGTTIATIDCDTVAGPTDGPLTTARPCLDEYSNCPALAQNSCYQSRIGESCRKSCGLCPGMTPASSYTCYDRYNNCASLCSSSHASDCRRSCGTCGGGSTVTVAPSSNSCSDQFGNCAELAQTACYQDHIREGCPRSCGQCPGQTPAYSARCYDHFTNCASYSSMCSNAEISSQCKITCHTDGC